MVYGRGKAGKFILMILAMSMAGLTGCCVGQGSNIARAAQGDTVPLAKTLTDPVPSLHLLDTVDPVDQSSQAPEAPLGLKLHGSKVLEIHHLTITGQPKPPDLGTSLPGLVFRQRLEADVEGIWSGIWVRGSFNDDPFFPQYMLQLDMPSATITLGDTNIKTLSSPLSPLDLPLTGAQGTLNLGDFVFSLAAGHTQTLTQVETFALYPTAGVYQTGFAPILPGTEQIRIDETDLVPHQDYLIDYDLGQFRLLGFWPGARELVISYQVPDQSLGKKPLVQGFRGEYHAKHGTLGLTHMARSNQDYQDGDSASYPLTQAHGLSSKAQLAWSALSWEQGSGHISPYLAAEVWRRRQSPMIPSSQMVEDMELHPFRHPLVSEISDPTTWSKPTVTSGSALKLSKRAGYTPIEGVSSLALGLDFTLVGTGATAKTRLALPTPLNLETESMLLLTLGLMEPLPGVKLEVALISGTSGSFQQSISLGSLVGWQDLVLAPDAWTKAGIPTWKRITAIELKLTSLLPGTLEGQIALAALDATGANQATDRWQSLRPRNMAIDIKTIPVPSAPWLPSPSNTALSITMEKLKEGSPIASPQPPLKEDNSDPEMPQVWGIIPRTFAPNEGEILSFWAHAPEPGMGLTIWLLDVGGKASNPFRFQLSAGWHQYHIPLSKLVAHFWGEAISSIVLSITPAPRRNTATLLLDEWQLSGMHSTESYMTRFAASKDDGLVHWRLTGSGQTEGFRWDAPGMQPNVPHPNHLALETTWYRPGNKHMSFSILQAGMTDGKTRVKFEADTWDRTMVDGQVTLPSGANSTAIDSPPTPATGHFRLRTKLDRSTWQLSAFKQLRTSPMSEIREYYPWETQIDQGMALSVQQRLIPGVVHLGTWHLAEGTNGQGLSADLKWNFIDTLPVSATLNIQRYQPSPASSAKLGGFGLLEATWENPEGNWGVLASFDQRVGRKQRSFATQPGPWLRRDEYSLDGQLPWESWRDSPRLWQQEAVLGWQWQLNDQTTLKAHWQRQATKELESTQRSLENTGSLSIIWPTDGSWRHKGTINQSRRQDESHSSVQSTEYSIASEGSWHEDWSLGLFASQKQTKWQGANLMPNTSHRGERWLLKGHTDYAYKPHGSIGVNGTLSHQTTTIPGIGDDDGYYGEWSWVIGSGVPWKNSTESGEHSIGESWSQPYMALPTARAGGAPGTCLDTQIRWALAHAAFYQVSLGTFIYTPLTSISSQVDYYGQASIEKTWGALGTGRLEVSAGLGSQAAWAIGLGWTKQLLKGEKGLYLKAGMRHVEQPECQLTDTRLALEYRF